ncbi:unnamed protein product [Pleuronectes platessa]|uniref:Uncharacterized protein n=1 Tax=Pleuronectes platessa TaxID=8262 RepID=A0A9N7UJR4_PLEPL|nr:unnamed protein product [Pleuronectes platessa]
MRSLLTLTPENKMVAPVSESFSFCLVQWEEVENLCLFREEPSLNPDSGLDCDIVLLNRWSVRNYEVQRGDIVSVVRTAPNLIQPLHHQADEDELLMVKLLSPPPSLPLFVFHLNATCSACSPVDEGLSPRSSRVVHT